MEIIKEKAKIWEQGKAKTITFIVTKDCQLVCKYCYLVGKNNKERMSFDVAKKAIDYILREREIFKEPSVVFDFIGGEPLMEIELIDKITDYIKNKLQIENHPWLNAYRFNFSTNGLMYNDKRVQQYIQKNKEEISIGITIDGTQKKHDLQRVFANGKGSYNEIIDNVSLWIKQFGTVDTKVTVSSDDIPYIKESILHLWSIGITHVYINVVFENIWKEGDDLLLEEQLMSLADEIIEKEYYKNYTCSFFSENLGKPLDRKFHNQNWCGTGRMLAVDAVGNFYPCTRFAGYSLREKKPAIIGNIHDGIDQNKLRPYLTLDRCTQSSQECIDCEVADGCAWCQGENYDSADTPTIFQRATPICKMHKARVRANNYYWNKLFRKLELEGELENFESKETHIIC